MAQFLRSVLTVLNAPFSTVFITGSHKEGLYKITFRGHDYFCAVMTPWASNRTVELLDGLSWQGVQTDIVNE